jgi:hypothetical protein
MQQLQSTLTEVQAEFQVQQLIWQSLPRRGPDGLITLGVAIEGSPQAFVGSEIQLTMQLAAKSPVAAITSLQKATKQPQWDSSVIAASLDKAICNAVAALQYHDGLTKIPSYKLSSGRKAEDISQDCPAAKGEKEELENLLRSTQWKNGDLVKIADVFGIKMVPKSPAEAPKAADSNQQAPSQSSSHSRYLGMNHRRLKVKNTFLELDGSSRSDDDGLRSHCSSQRSRSLGASQRSRSVPPSSHCSERSYTGADSATDIDTDVECGDHSTS